MASTPGSSPADRLAELERQLKELQKRVAVLERRLAIDREHPVDRTAVRGKVTYDWQG